MSRSQRLLELLQLLRRHRYPVTGERLAQELGISLRTLYRDIATLQQQGADIQGEAGVGYVLKPGFMLPPLMFSEEELEALVLGSRWVAERADRELSDSANSVLSKISAVLPADLRQAMDANTLLIGPSGNNRLKGDEVTLLRRAIRDGLKVSIDYRSLEERESKRTVWPFALGYFNEVCLLLAWCETRQAFRNFRTDRIQQLQVEAQRYPTHRFVLLKAWREEEKKRQAADKN
ncbi:Transcriptional regulator, DeoR family [Marinobacterium lacunae]|uniref:Transcriptional regulator, DeoR family n=1 Tax=Marinobacterium lacunae TaxID=1232683 RepID=A0A081FWH1_9GAMM|nr:YafY family protein [Marinobacterium lacunae]KEA62876.1 Transcriptional regulator, DeoR family [Marinobacterium lacunae]